ncbi:amino acid adenylation domain-containing protein [bacterium AH-315-K03]|nr:amino acid adenylation domain-containing protein [bacterium AH-315-K03]
MRRPQETNIQFTKLPFSKIPYGQHKISMDILGPLNITIFTNTLEELVNRRDNFNNIIHIKYSTRELENHIESNLKIITKENYDLAINRNTNIGKNITTIDTDNSENNFLPFSFTLIETSHNQYLFIMKCNTTISDIQSMKICLNDIIEIYSALSKKNKIPDKTNNNFHTFQKNSHNKYSTNKKAYDKFWLSILEKKITPINFEYIKNTNKAKNIQITKTLETQLSEKLNSFIKKENINPLFVLHSSFIAYLSQIFDQEDIVTLLHSTRNIDNNSNYKDVTGPCSVLLPIRSSIIFEKSYLSLLENTTTTILAAHKYIDYFHVNSIHESNLDEKSILKFIFSDEDTPAFPIIDGVRFNNVKENQLKLDPTLMFVKNNGNYSLKFYSDNNFSEKSIEDIFSNYSFYLYSVLENPQLALNKHDLLSPKEKRIILEKLGNNTTPYPQYCAHELVEQQTTQSPDSIALVFKNKQLSFLELNHKANQIAHQLLELKNKDGQKNSINMVGICVERSLEMVIGILAALKSGLAYVPIDPSFPQDRINFLINNAKINILLTQSHLKSRLSPRPQHLILLDKKSHYRYGKNLTESKENISVTDAGINNESLISVLYTSGSTGEPKGVLITHKGIVNRLHWMHSRFPFENGEVTAHMALLQFVRALWELLVPLVKGTKLIIMESKTVKDPEKLKQIINYQKITRIITAPSLAQTLVQPKDTSTNNLKILKYWFIGSDTLRYKVVSQVKRHYPDVLICNLYGSTEVHSFASHYIIEDPQSQGSVPIGRAIFNTQIVILDQFNRLLPFGFPGEICILGDSLAKGYLNKKQLTNKSFILNSVCPKWGKKLFKSGDLGKYSSKNNLVFIGRKDYQVKIRGIRIELGEIESQIILNDLVNECVVITREYGPEDYRLIAYIVPSTTYSNRENTGRIFIYELRHFLKKKLPQYMIPSFFVLIEKLPQNTHGKIIRGNLPDPDYNSVAYKEYVPPRNEKEKIICGIWEKILNLNQVGIEDDFYGLGGHSLLAAQITARINNRLSLDIPAYEILENENIKNLYDSIFNINSENKIFHRIKAIDKSHPTTIAFLQKMYWRFETESSNTIYSRYSLNIEGVVNPTALEKSLLAIIDRHDSLRLRFSVNNDQINMKTCNESEMDFSIINFEDRIDNNTDNKNIYELVKNISEKRFNHFTGPLFRVRLIQLSNKRSVLIIIISHVIMDAASTHILKKELGALYDHFCNKSKLTLPEIKTNYIDYSSWLNKKYKTKNKSINRYLKYFLGYVKNNNSFSKICISNKNKKNNLLYIERHSISDNPRNAITSYCSKNMITPYMYFMSIYHLSILKCTGLKNIIISSPKYLRDRDELENSFGLYLGYIFVESSADEKMKVKDFILNMKNNIFRSERDLYPRLEAAVGLNLSDLSLLVATNFFQYQDFYHKENWSLPGVKVKEFDDEEESRLLPKSTQIQRASFTMKIAREKNSLDAMMTFSGNKDKLDHQLFSTFSILSYIVANIENDEMTIRELMDISKKNGQKGIFDS